MPAKRECTIWFEVGDMSEGKVVVKIEAHATSKNCIFKLATEHDDLRIKTKLIEHAEDNNM